MFYGKTHKQVSLVGDYLMTSNPYWFNHQVVFFDEDYLEKHANENVSFYDIFVEQLDLKLYEEQFEEKLTSSNACFFFKS